MNISTLIRSNVTKLSLNRSGLFAWSVILGVVFVGGHTACAQKIDTIALYEFTNASSLFLDSSGNNNNLNGGTGVTQSTTEYSTAAPTQVSAVFNGSQNVAANFIPFGSYTAITFDWYMKTDGILTGTSMGTLFTSSWSTNQAGFFTIRIEANTAVENTVTLAVRHRLSDGWADTYFTITDPTSWKNYSVTIDNSVSNAEGHITLLLDGIAQSASSSVWGGGEGVTGTFLSGHYFYMGARDNNATPFDGYLQEVEIYNGTHIIPESSSSAIALGVVVFGLAMMRFRRRR